MSGHNEQQFDGLGNPGNTQPANHPRFSSFVRMILAARLPTWIVQVRNVRTGARNDATLLAETAEEAEAFAVADALDVDPGERFSVSAQLMMSPRRLWDVLIEDPGRSEILLRPRKPLLLGRVVASSEVEAREYARGTFGPAGTAVAAAGGAVRLVGDLAALHVREA